MAKENLEKFIKQLQADEALCEKYDEAVKVVGENELTPDKDAEIITALGYEVTAEELEERLKMTGTVELSDEETESAAGGYGYGEGYPFKVKYPPSSERWIPKKYVQCHKCGSWFFGVLYYSGGGIYFAECPDCGAYTDV